MLFLERSGGLWERLQGIGDVAQQGALGYALHSLADCRVCSACAPLARGAFWFPGSCASPPSAGDLPGEFLAELTGPLLKPLCLPGPQPLHVHANLPQGRPRLPR